MALDLTPTCRTGTSTGLAHWQRQCGFTAVELMVVVGIAAVLTTLAGPSFAQIIESWRVRSVQESLQSSLMLARSEAIKRGGRVAIQKIPNNTNGCTGAAENAAWNCGWLVCHDVNDNGRCDAGEAVLQRMESNGKVEVTRSVSNASIKLNRWGLVDGAWPGFSLVPLNKSIAHPGARGVCMSSGGRIQVLLPEAIPCRD
ncbi:GspH/FimT family pseudopilin [Paracidovorax sp. MALMAid1276]|uniref:GspH/FimT family pseudopilin n=1 Tax=Paracidovorax sp. MALMAid1276 TaxID=3411631 RepID=UPI003B99249A